MKRFVSILAFVSACVLSAERDPRLAIINGNTRNKVIVCYDPSISPLKNNSALSSPSVGRATRSLSPQVTPLASITVEPKRAARLQLLSTQSFLVTVQIEGFQTLKDFRIYKSSDPLIIMPECDNKIKIIHGLKQSAIMTKDSAPKVVQLTMLKKEDIIYKQDDVDECVCSLQ